MSRAFLKKGGLKAGFALKTAAAFLFCAAGIFAVLERGINESSALILAAFLLCFAGDVLLALGGLAKEEYLKFFSVLGGSAFLFGHALYATAFLSLEPLKLYLIPLFAATPLALGAVAAKKGGEAKRNLPLLLVYGAALGAALTSTLNLALAGRTAGYIALTAAVLFALSDGALLAFNFGSEKIRAKSDKLRVYFVMLPYFSAQFLFALSILYI
jgi:uncharacterized membrane protein YhhN